MYPTEKQLKPLKRLKAALKACEKENVYFHNCYGTLCAFDGEKVECVNDVEDEKSIPEPSGDFYQITLPCCEYADDSHFIHLKDNNAYQRLKKRHQEFKKI